MKRTHLAILVSLTGSAIFILAKTNELIAPAFLKRLEDSKLAETQEDHIPNNSNISNSAPPRTAEDYSHPASLEGLIPSTDPSERVNQIEQSSPDLSSEAFSLPSTPPRASSTNPSEYSLDSLEQLKSLRAAREAEIAALNQAIAELSEGDFFHNVPAKMEVNKPVIIESGITIDDVEAILERHSITGEVTTQSGVLFDPLGTEIELITPSDAFIKEPIHAGRKTVLSGDEPLWSWRVIPMKAGQHLIVVKVKVELKSPLTGQVYPKEFTTFRQHRQVNVNYAYSLQSFVSNNWEEILTRIIGPGTIFGGIGWLVGKRQQRVIEKNTHRGGFLGDVLEKSGKGK